MPASELVLTIALLDCLQAENNSRPKNAKLTDEEMSEAAARGARQIKALCAVHEATTPHPAT